MPALFSADSTQGTPSAYSEDVIDPNALFSKTALHLFERYSPASSASHADDDLRRLTTCRDCTSVVLCSDCVAQLASKKAYLPSLAPTSTSPTYFCERHVSQERRDSGCPQNRLIVRLLPCRAELTGQEGFPSRLVRTAHLGHGLVVRDARRASIVQALPHLISQLGHNLRAHA